MSTTQCPIFVAVHVGAGRLSTAKEARYRSACARACESAMAMLKNGEQATDAIVRAISLLEDDPITNAGLGSNFTLQGTVECDASMMDGRTGTFGAVGAVSGIKNPITAANKLVEKNKEGVMSLGRIPPVLLAGQGAMDWAKENGCEIVDKGALMHESSYSTYVSHMAQLYSAAAPDPVELGHDTVGAIAIDRRGNVASGVSSGGISLKYSGRIGEAAMYGCGCWAQNSTYSSAGIACSTSGTGEQIMRTMLTSKCVARLDQETDMHKAISDALTIDFLDSPMLQMYPDKSAGIITLRMQETNSIPREHHFVSMIIEWNYLFCIGSLGIEFWYGHVTDSMGIGFMSETFAKPKTFISRKPCHEKLTCSGYLIPTPTL
ncbi:nucleophile aminohydrolase [Radiomyces spectabilis]|uniref:nucleophile aminohydrolase n=1 Tax=Radiomyces spectabilis TaxID=64574 RepID=UPI00221F7A02|nr:nucleophile aminohydrolase [Radiomyces spectabilis]KAI8372931.1 nucleophile aminohydrolase [Radiomyces spectabilis]